MQSKNNDATPASETKGRNLDTLLMVSSRKIGVTREMLQQAVNVLQPTEHAEPRRQRYYWS